MTWVTLRLHRNQSLFALGALLAIIAFLVPTGTYLANTYHQALATCDSSSSCGSLSGDLFQSDGWMFGLVTLLTLVVPGLFGVFWGAPLFAKELEDGTHTLVWTQTITRRRWLFTKIIYALIGAAIWGTVMSAMVTWWLGPHNALTQDQFLPNHFDIQGIVPVAYSLFAVGLGMASGAWFRRVLPAIAVTVGGFIGVRALVELLARPHYLSPITQTLSLVKGPVGGPRGSAGPLPGAWILSTGLVNPAGQRVGLSPASLPPACRAAGQIRLTPDCLASHGWHMAVSYQPADRFWAFQGIEAGIFIVLATILVGLAGWRILKMDA